MHPEEEEDEERDYVRIPRRYWELEFDVAEDPPVDPPPEAERPKRKRARQRKPKADPPARTPEPKPYKDRHPLDFLLVELHIARNRLEVWTAPLWFH